VSRRGPRAEDAVASGSGPATSGAGSSRGRDPRLGITKRRGPVLRRSRPAVLRQVDAARFVEPDALAFEQPLLPHGSHRLAPVRYSARRVDDPLPWHFGLALARQVLQRVPHGAGVPRRERVGRDLRVRRDLSARDHASQLVDRLAEPFGIEARRSPVHLSAKQQIPCALGSPSGGSNRSRRAQSAGVSTEPGSPSRHVRSGPQSSAVRHPGWHRG